MWNTYYLLWKVIIHSYKDLKITILNSRCLTLKQCNVSDYFPQDDTTEKPELFYLAGRINEHLEMNVNKRVPQPTDNMDRGRLVNKDPMLCEVKEIISWNNEEEENI